MPRDAKDVRGVRAYEPLTGAASLEPEEAAHVLTDDEVEAMVAQHEALKSKHEEDDDE